jgi:benzoyl-CoA 2,3-epoxidase subunit B
VREQAGGIKNETSSTRNSMNGITRLAYVKDCNVVLTRWNMGIHRAGLEFEFNQGIAVGSLPSKALR